MAIPFVTFFVLVSRQESRLNEEQWHYNILPNITLASSLEWTPDGKYIVWSGQGSMYLVRTDGMEFERISKEGDDEFVVEVGHDISPDGTRLVYVTSRHQKTAGFDLETSNLDGSQRTRLTTDGVGTGDTPAWSPDGSLIATVFGRQILIIASDGTQLRSIEVPGGGFRAYLRRGPVWSPDGETIALATLTTGRPPDEGTVLYSINADGTGVMEAFVAPWPSDSTIKMSRPAWSPDGNYLAFALSFGQADMLDIDGLYVVKPDGTDLRRLTVWGHRVGIVNRVEWSPDAEELLTDSGLIVSVKDGSSRRVFSDKWTGFATWSPDGSRIAFWEHGSLLTIARDGTDRRNIMQVESP